ncbi:M48 family metalloprotease [Desulfococcaceae bacterium OttesenSCG-928-F15]|nr:M48 family metalloprotease [Desulfococcaceae bacterium OttesenSCG-928-F15]
MSPLRQRVPAVFFSLFLVLSLLLSPGILLGLTMQEEEELGEKFTEQVRHYYRIVRDPLIVSYVREVGNRIVQQIENPPFSITFDAIIDPTFNAFAGPGGHIYVHSGLIMAMEKEADLAGILGHEIAHVTCRHISELVDRSKKVGLATLAGLGGAILAALAGADGDAAIGLLLGTQAAGQSAMLSYTRENERQADERGLAYLTASGYGGEGLLRSLRTIRSQEWYSTEDVPVYLRTHPGTDERIAFVSSWLEDRARNKKKEADPPNPSDDNRFYLVKTRLQARYGDKDTVIPMFRKALEREPNNQILRQGLSIALARKGEDAEALFLMEQVFRARPMDIWVMGDLGRIRHQAGRSAEAIPLLEIAVSENSDPEIRFDLGRAYTASTRYDEAIRIFKGLIETEPALIGSWYTLAEAYGKQGREGLSHYCLGRYNEFRRDFANAGFHYDRSLKTLPKDVPEWEDAKKRAEEMKKAERGSSAPGRGRR